MASGTAEVRAPVQSDWTGGWRCPEHSERPAELFCRRCSRCVCALCPVLGAHRGHPVGLAEEEAARAQKLMQECLECLATKKRQHADNIAQLEDTGERLKVSADSSKAWLTQKFTELRLLLDEEEALAKSFIDKNTQLTLQVYQEQAESCRKQIEVMSDFSIRVWDISQVSNPVQLLQAYIATKAEMGQQMSPSELSHPVPLSFEPVKNFFKEFVEAIRNTLQTPMDTRLKENINCQLSSSSSTKPGALLKTSPSPERALFLKYARTPTLDPDTMHARLRLSTDGLTVRCSLLGRLGPRPAPRFDSLRLRLRRDPHRLGVFLDYEAGILTFYDVAGGMSHLHTFYAVFQEPLYPALRLWEGTISIPRLP